MVNVMIRSVKIKVVQTCLHADLYGLYSILLAYKLYTVYLFFVFVACAGINAVGLA